MVVNSEYERIRKKSVVVGGVRHLTDESEGKNSNVVSVAGEAAGTENSRPITQMSPARSQYYIIQLRFRQMCIRI
jgi:hypothetical protein